MVVIRVIQKETHDLSATIYAPGVGVRQAPGYVKFSGCTGGIHEAEAAERGVLGVLENPHNLAIVIDPSCFGSDRTRDTDRSKTAPCIYKPIDASIGVRERPYNLALAATGAVLWASGSAEQPRRAIAVAMQMGGEIARGAVLLLSDNNRYSAAALIRQLVEIEYLLCLFAEDENELGRWASSDLATVKHMFQPREMRRRCGERFRVEEYSNHCEVGGHPRFAGAHVLPEHFRLGPLSDEAIFAAGWVDLAQHLVQVWRWVEEILVKYDLLTIGLAESSLVKAKDAMVLWLREDYCAPFLTEGEAQLLAQVAFSS